MKPDLSMTGWAVVSYMFFITAWGIPQILFPLTAGEGDLLHHLLWGIVYLGLAGTALPLYLSGKYGMLLYDPDVPQRSFIIGIAALLAAAVIGIFLSGSFDQIMENRPPAHISVKYLLLCAPMAMALALQCFFIIPSAVTALLGGHNGARSLAIVVSALCLGLGFFVDDGLTFSGNAVNMTVLGLFFGTVAVLTRSVYLTALILFLVMLSNNLAEAKYHYYPWYATVTGFAVCLTAFLMFYLRVLLDKRTKRE